MKRTSLLVGSAFALAAGGALALACGGGDFYPQSRVDSVRLFAVRADKPYVKPGETVTLEAFLTDARKTKPLPLKLSWIPVICLNPGEDLYYRCFFPGGDGSGGSLVPVGAAADAGTSTGTPSGGGGGNPLEQIPTGVDLTPFLPQGTTFSFQMPADAIKQREGSEPYGLAIIFNIACAGRVEFAPRDASGGPQQVPILCTDQDGQKLSPQDYVIGISRVYAYAEKTNENPVIEKVTLNGADVDLTAGITLDRCTTEKSADCPDVTVDVRVPDTSWEVNVSSGASTREQIWAAYYTDRGDLENDARLLFDPGSGRIDDSGVKFRPFKDPGDGSIWVVVHDNRGGAAWTVIPVHVK